MRLSVRWPICNQQSIDSVFVYCYCEFVVAAIAFFFHWFTLLHIARHRDRLLTHTKFWYERGQWQKKSLLFFLFALFLVITIINYYYFARFRLCTILYLPGCFTASL